MNATVVSVGLGAGGPAGGAVARPRAPADVPPHGGTSLLSPDPSGLSRRRFLSRALTGGATIAVIGTGALSYRVFDTAVLDPHHRDAYDAWTTWRDAPGPLGAVAASILAANPHNTQPWTFRATSDVIDLHADPARRVVALDPLARETQVGLGCALENLVLAARARGLDPVVTLLPDSSDKSWVASVALSTGRPEPSKLYDAIGDRHSNRGVYTDQVVTTETLALLVDAEDLPGVEVHWITGAAAIQAMGTLMIDAATAVTQDKQQSVDGFVWFRSNDDEVEQHRDGLTLDGQGLSPAILTMAKLLPASSRTAGDAFWVTQTRDVHTATAAAYGVITVADAGDPASRLAGGRLLQRVHLTATSRGVAMQHMNQITERIDRDAATGSADEFGARLQALLPPGVQPLSSFRVGYPAREARLSPRRSADEVMT